MNYHYLAEAISSGVESSFLGQGIAGAAALIFLAAAIYLYKTGRDERKASQAREDLLLSKLEELQDKRVLDAERHRDEVAGTLKSIAEQQQKIYDQSIISNNRQGA